MDRERLEQIIGAAQNRYGITISTDDPIFAMVFLNEAILNEAMLSAFAKIEPIARVIYDAEKTVPRAIQESADDAIQRLTQIAGSIIKVSDSLKANLATYIHSGVSDARNEILRIGIESQNKIQTELSQRLQEIERATLTSKKEIALEASRQSVAINKLFGETVRASLAEHSQRIAPAPFKSRLKLIAACLFVSALSSALTYGAIRYFEDIKQQQAINIGEAVQGSWSQLDEKSRAIIRSNINRHRGGNG